MTSCKPNMLSLERLKALLAYEPMTGHFRWRVSRGRVAAGDIAGTIKPNGYRCIKIDRRNYYAHRLAWFYSYEEWPLCEVDHRNCQTDDNSLENLREATGTQNQGNRRPNAGLDTKGITYHKRDKRWQAQITINGVHTHLGQFLTQEQALHAYAVAAQAYFGEFARLEEAA